MKVLVTVFALFFSGLVAAAPLKNIVVFGDSLSDNGNLYEFMQHHVPLSPPYYEGRFTNGPVWVEQLTASYFPVNSADHLLDYAFGGAGISTEADDDDDALFTLKHEIDTYLLEHDDKADSESLYVVWIGANNYLAVPDNVEETISVVNKGIGRSMERLIRKGAKNFLILNLPDLGRTPAAREFDAEEQLSIYSKKHNETLANMTINYQATYPDVKWVYYDLNAAVNEIMETPEKFGFSNVFDTCYDEVIEKPTPYTVIKMARHATKMVSNEACSGFLFFDPVHPTGPAHQLIADRVRGVLDAAGVEFSSW